MAEANVTHQLPTEVLEKIFEHCRPNLNQLVNIVDVCQLSRDVAIREYNRSGNDLVIRRPDDINDLVSLLCKPVSFTKLHVVWDVPIYEDCRRVSLDALANVTSLNHLQSFMFRVERLDRGECHKVGLLDALLMLLRKTSRGTLTHCKLMSARFGSSSKVVEVMEACQHLSHLVLKGCKLTNVEEQRCVEIIPTLTHLELLDLRRTYVSDNLSFIAAIKRGCPNISNNIMIDWLQVRPSDDVSMLQFVSHVDRLDLHGLDTEKLRSLVSSLHERVSQLSVDKLWVAWSKDHITDDILLSLVQSLRGVKEVGASRCHHLTNEGVVNVITSSPQLKEIIIHGIQNIDTGIIQLLEGIEITFVQNIDTDILPLLDRVVTKQNVRIYAYTTKLSEQMRNNPERELYTGKNGNICLMYRP